MSKYYRIRGYKKDHAPIAILVKAKSKKAAQKEAGDLMENIKSIKRFENKKVIICETVYIKPDDHHMDTIHS